MAGAAIEVLLEEAAVVGKLEVASVLEKLGAGCELLGIPTTAAAVSTAEEDPPYSCEVEIAAAEVLSVHEVEELVVEVVHVVSEEIAAAAALVGTYGDISEDP